MNLTLRMEQIELSNNSIFGVVPVSCKDRTYIANYGMNLYNLGITYNLMVSSNTEYYNTKEKKASTKHFLWALYFLKNYPSTDNMVAIFDTNDKTLRKWIWIVIDMIKNIDNVS